MTAPALGDIKLFTPEGAPTSLRETSNGRPTVVQLVRYFGCLPCQEYAVALDRARASWPDVDVVIVGGSADYQAQYLRDELGVTAPLLLDPDQELRDAVGASRLLVGRMLSPKGARSYMSALRGGYAFQRPTRDALRSPGVAVLDADLDVKWTYVGKRLGDYPDLDLVARKAGALVA
jgi:hypothetical protein